MNERTLELMNALAGRALPLEPFPLHVALRRFSPCLRRIDLN